MILANDTIAIWSPFGDTGIIIFVILLLWKFKKRVLLGNSHGTNRKKFRISDEDIESDIFDAVVGLYVFSGNEYLTSFFCEGKNIYLTTMISSSTFLDIFKTIRDSWETVAKDFATETFLWKLYK